jgi:hypothetical protein
MKLGETFLGLIDEEHLCVVFAGDLHGEVCVANLTSHRVPCDESCVIERGEHPFVQHRTVVSYQRAFTKANAELDAQKASGVLRMREPVSASLLVRIQNGAVRSQATPRKIKEATRKVLT